MGVSDFVGERYNMQRDSLAKYANESALPKPSGSLQTQKRQQNTQIPTVPTKNNRSRGITIIAPAIKRTMHTRVHSGVHNHQEYKNLKQ